jgi:PEP-CTERM motif-containing protein
MKNRILFLTTLLLAGLGLMLGVTLAHADLLVYSVQALANGSLNEQPFSNAVVTVTGIGNTNNITPTATGFTNNLITTTVTVAGLGTDTFTSPLTVFDYQSGTFGPYATIMNVVPTTSLGTSSATFGTYTLSTSITVTGMIFMVTLGGNTLAGTFSMTPVSPTETSTFTARAPVPEPLSSTLLLLGVAVLGLRARMRRQGN